MIESTEIQFIENNFYIRICEKYCGERFELCKCNRPRSCHIYFPDSDEKWSLERNTIRKKCDTFGRIRFMGFNEIFLHHSPKFIRFDYINQPLIYECVYKLICYHWKVPPPKLIISINGGFKRMNFKTNQIKKNFKQGLIDVISKDDTWIIGGGFNVGVHKLVSEAVHEYRLHQENSSNTVTLISISSWGVVYNNVALLPNSHMDPSKKDYRKFTYKNNVSDIRGKVALDPHYDCFLFCDDGTDGQYDREVEFRMELQKYIVNDGGTFIVQVLFEGGKRALYSAYDAVKNRINVVVIKGSGRAANILSKSLELSNRKFKDNINSILEDNKDCLNILPEEVPQLKSLLSDIYTNYKKQIIIHDMYDPNLKLDKSILEAIIAGRDENTLKKTLKLTIRFDCPTIADKAVFLSSNYLTIKPKSLDKMFLDVLRNNKFEFVRLFLQNGLDIENVITKSELARLYRDVSELERSQCSELLYDMLNDTNTWLHSQKSKTQNDESFLQAVGSIIPDISGNILKPRYGKPAASKNTSSIRDMELSSPNAFDTIAKATKSTVSAQDMLLWALLSGQIELAEIFWEIGKDHVGSALIASTILKNLAFRTVKRGDIDLEKKLTNASQKFQDLATNIVFEAYNRSKSKTYSMLVRALERWDYMTCIQIAISGSLLDFLNNSACGSYAMKVWMGNMSPFLSYWKILINIPFSVLLIKPTIVPYLNNEEEESISAPTFRDDKLEASLDNQLAMNPKSQKSKRKKAVAYHSAIKIFYEAPIVKFTINLMSYITFLVIFSYMNLCELRYEFTSMKDRWAETFVCVYVVSLIMEEIRQVVDQERTGNIMYKFIAYLSGSWNIYDCILIVLFIITVFVRYIVDEANFEISRCLFSLSLSMFCLRTMQFYFVNKSIGPKVIMIRDMIRDILFFLSIFAIFILSYGTLAHSLTKPNSNVTVFLLKDIIYLPYFQTYGEVMLDKFDVTPPYSPVIRTTVLIGFGIFLLLTNILLINLLIAMFGYTFNQIQGNSRKHWSFIKIQLVEEFYEKPILPPPFNLIYYIFIGFFLLLRTRCDKCKVSPNNLLIKYLKADENFKISGYEQFCMETIMSETNTLRSSSNSEMDSMIQNLNEILEKVVATPETNLLSKDPPFRRSASVQKRQTIRLDKFFEEQK